MAGFRDVQASVLDRACRASDAHALAEERM
jgi:hypothetical protein